MSRETDSEKTKGESLKGRAESGKETDNPRERVSYRLVSEDFPFGYHVLDKDGNIIHVNDAWLRATGYRRDEVEGKWFGDFLVESQREAFKERHQALDRSGDIHDLDLELITKSGDTLSASVDGAILPENNPEVSCTHCIIRNGAQKAEREERSIYGSIFRDLVMALSTRFINMSPTQIDDGIDRALMEIGVFCQVDRSYVFEFSADRFRMTNTHEWCADGIEPEKDNLADVPAGDLPWFIENITKKDVVHLADVDDLPESAAAEKEHFKEQGIKSLVAVPMLCRGELAGFVGFDSVREKKDWTRNDIDLLKILAMVFANALDRKRMDQALVEKSDFLEKVINSAVEGVFVLDEKSRYKLINRAGERIAKFGADKWLGRSAGSRLHKEDVKAAVEAFRDALNGKARELEIRVESGIGEWRTLQLRLSPLTWSGKPHALGVVSDVTEKRMMEDELLKVQKLESVGTLAGGIAHEFNNILTAVLGNLSLAKMLGDLDDEITEIVDEAEKAGQRAKHLTHQLLTFSRGGDPVKETVLLDELINESVDLALRGSNVKAEIETPDDLWPAEVDRAQIGQVLSNLAINADQAMPEGGTILVRAGNLSVKTDKMTVGEGYGAVTLPRGDYVSISVTDRGVGIGPEIMPRIFDPYFTTKEKGSGLGLATSYSIASKHGAYIQVKSVPGEGSTFTVHLPAQGPGAKTGKTGQTKDLAGIRVLLMDDEDMVRKVARRMIENMGCAVETAADGAEALVKYEMAMRSGKTFDLVIMDLTVPGGMGGKKAIQKLKEMDPEVKAVVSSGYSNDPVMANHADFGFAGVVGKPFRIKELKKVMEKALGTSG